MIFGHRSHVGKFTGKKKFNSTALANARKAMYIRVHVTPIFQSKRKRFNANARYKPNKVESKDPAE